MLVTNELAVSLRVIICFEEPIRFLKVVLIHIQKSFLCFAPQVIPSFLHRQLHCWKWHVCKTAICISYKGQEPMQQISVSPHRECERKGEGKFNCTVKHIFKTHRNNKYFMSHTFLTFPPLCTEIAVMTPPVANYFYWLFHINHLNNYLSGLTFSSSGQRSVLAGHMKALMLWHNWVSLSNIFPLSPTEYFEENFQV